MPPRRSRVADGCPLALAAWVGLAGIAALAGPARAATVYNYVTDSANYSAPAGASVPVKIYLQETLTGASTSLMVGDRGLFNAGAVVTYAASAGAKGSGSPAVLSAVALDGAEFRGPASQFFAPNGSSMNFQEAADSFGSSGPAGAPGGSGRLQFLGTLTITAGSLGNTTSFSLGERGGVGNTITFTNGFDLDDDGSGTAADGTTYTWTGADGSLTPFSVTAVPEPGGLAPLALLGLLGLRTSRKTNRPQRYRGR